MPTPSDRLTEAWRRLGITVDRFWIEYFRLGGDCQPTSIAALVNGEWEPSRREYNLLAQALNEIHVDRGGNHPVPYWDALPP